MIGKNTGGVFVLILNPDRSGEVFVSYLIANRRGEVSAHCYLKALTDVQNQKGATEQWVSVVKANQKGIPIYEARGIYENAGFPSVEKLISLNILNFRSKCAGFRSKK